MKDEVYSYNHARWEALVKADALFTQPKLDMDPESACGEKAIHSSYLMRMGFPPRILIRTGSMTNLKSNPSKNHWNINKP